MWRQTCGQPWLVNALCSNVCFGSDAGRDRSRAITAGDILDAQEHLILSRVTHLDQLADKLREDRVRRVVEPLLSGGDRRSFTDRDLEYVRDLGLVAQGRPVCIANPIYAEVVPRELIGVAQEELTENLAWYVDAAGGLDRDMLLAAFQVFSASTPSTGWRASATRKRARSFCCKRSYSGSSTGRPHQARVRAGPGMPRPTDHLAVRAGASPSGADGFVVECRCCTRP